MLKRSTILHIAPKYIEDKSQKMILHTSSAFNCPETFVLLYTIKKSFMRNEQRQGAFEK